MNLNEVNRGIYARIVTCAYKKTLVSDISIRKQILKVMRTKKIVMKINFQILILNRKIKRVCI